MREVEVHDAATGDEAWDRRRSEEALRESQSAFRELLESAPAAVVLSDAEDRVTDVNEAVCKLNGFSREELLGKTYRDFLEPEEAARFERDLPHAAGLIQRSEWRVKRKDGTFVAVEASIKRLPDGRSLTFVHDITERKRVERERDESNRWMRAVLEQSPIGMVRVHGPSAGEVELNDRAQQVLGRPNATYDELRARICAQDGRLPDPDELPIARALRGELTVGAEFFVRNAAGECMPISARGAPIVGPDGAVLGAVVAFEDITAAKELERLRAEWSSVIAHDLRQPLATISLSTQVLARATDDAELLKSFDRIRAAADRLNRMVADLMDLSRLEASRLQLELQRVDVPGLVRAAAERVELGTTDRHFDVRVDGEVPEAHADPDRIAQVLDNLLTNAVKYGKAGTPVVMTVAREGDEIAIDVTNQGRHLSAEEIAHMFERFRRAASAKLEGIQGVGLGLYITRSLVEAHGGHLTAESTPEGVTTLRFTLPIAGK